MWRSLAGGSLPPVRMLKRHAQLMISTSTCPVWKELQLESAKEGERVECLTIPEIASRLRITPQAIYQRAQRGDFEVVVIGRAMRVPKEDFKRWLSEHTRLPKR